MKEKPIKITVQTLPNGYELKIGGQEYMYFNVMDLLAGFMIHVGMQEPKYMDNGNILTMLFHTMMGHEWEESVTALRTKVSSMEANIMKTLSHLEQAASAGDRLEPQVNTMTETIRTLQDSIAKQKAENNESLKAVREMSKTAKETVSDCRKESKKLADSVGKINQFMADVNDIKKTATEHSDNLNRYERRIRDTLLKLEKDGQKILKEQKEHAQTDDASKPKKSGSRKRNDEAIIAEIDKQSSENKK
jgi:predicted translin family RNA/ssDNA-binding protein